METVAILFKGEGTQISNNLDVFDDTLLQFGPLGSYRMDTNRAYYKWIVPKCSATSQQTFYLADWAGFNINDTELHSFFDEHNQMFDLITQSIQIKTTVAQLWRH